MHSRLEPAPVTPDLYTLAVALVLRERRTSTTRLQRHFQTPDGECVGYNRCAFYLARMELEGIVGRVDTENRRDVLAWIQ
jgi:S-DNA-T family DNA segregation ATPase FtsK/SpoIIIE